MDNLIDYRESLTVTQGRSGLASRGQVFTSEHPFRPAVRSTVTAWDSAAQSIAREKSMIHHLVQDRGGNVGNGRTRD